MSKTKNLFADIIQGQYGQRKIGSQWFSFVLAPNRFGIGDLYQVNLDTLESDKVSDNLSWSNNFLLGADGVIAARDEYEGYSKTWRMFAGAKGKTVITEITSPFRLVSFAGLGRTAASAIIENDQQISEIPIAANATPVRLFADAWVDEFLHEHETGFLIGAKVADERGAVFFDDARQKRYDAAKRAFAGLTMDLVSYSDDLHVMLVFTQGHRDSGTYWVLNATTGKAEELTTAYSGIGPDDVGPVRLFAYHASDGLALEGVLTLPPAPAKGPLPLIVMPHGGPIGIRDRPAFDWWAQAFASRGYAVLQPNYRGSGGYGRAFQEAGMGQWGDKMLTDMSDGVAALAKAGTIDPRKVCIVGASYGGYAALAGVVLQHGIYRCAVSVSGVSDVGAIMRDAGDSSDSPGGRYIQRMFGVKFAGDPALAGISPVRRAAEAGAPILLVHGKNDTVVPFVHSESMAFALGKAGKPFEFTPLETEDHWMSLGETRLQMLRASVTFVEKYNPPS